MTYNSEQILIIKTHIYKQRYFEKGYMSPTIFWFFVSKFNCLYPYIIDYGIYKNPIQCVFVLVVTSCDKSPWIKKSLENLIKLDDIGFEFSKVAVVKEKWEFDELLDLDIFM